ncbi:GlcG/HbpS family heme-binding protein [Corynebacterium flavescens]|uniref:GlcG/HbpS family heme-binding protein n=1 Tax=Corynebacterium flavescens TaxID=28028 RepID=UPI003F50F071
MVKTQTTLTLDDAQRIIEVGIAASTRIGSPSNIAVADAGGNLIAHARMDGAQLGSIEHSVDKAHTAAFFRSATGDLAEDSQPGGQFWGMALSGGGRVLVFAGGVPLIVDGEVVGAVGISGGSQEQDSTIAQCAAAVAEHR